MRKLLSANFTRTVLFTLAIWMGLVFVANNIGNRLDIPQMKEDVVYLNGEPVALNRTPNPLYLKGIVRKAFEYLYEFIPVGQTMLMHDVAIEHPLRQIAFSVVFTVYAMLSGLVSFHRKDLN